MGIGRDSREMVFFVVTEPMTQEHYHELIYKDNKHLIKDWSCEPNDKELFENDETNKKYLKEYYKAKQKLKDHQDLKRKQNGTLFS